VPNVRFQLSSPDYFRAVGMRLKSGRFFSPEDTEKSASVAIVNESFARQYFPDEEPIGKVIYLGAPLSLLPQEPDAIPVPRRTIVGVVADVKGSQLTQPARAEVYAPYRQSIGEGWTNDLRLAVRSNVDPMTLVGAIRAQVRSLDPEQPVADVNTLEALLGRSSSVQRFNAMLMLAFAGLALLLAAVGIYGVLSYTVERRTHEIGVRMALGAGRTDVLRLVVGHAAILSAIGVALGLAASAGLTRLMDTLLFDVSPTDTVTFVALSLVLMGTSLLASYLPARRAARMDPMMALRCE
jgi:putative ABC transport system permease protein